MLKKLLIAAAVLALAPTGTAQAHESGRQGYYGGSYYSGDPYWDYRYERKKHRRYHRNLRREHREAHRDGFYSRRDHRAYHRWLERRHGGYHDDRDWGYRGRYYRDGYRW